MSESVRLLNLGAVSPLRSQALYHGLAQSMDEESPDTIVLCRPTAPYFCVGYHQSPRAELDLAWCRENGYPVFQRRIGGGTVFLDPNQLFYQCIFHRSRAPFDVASIYRRFLTPPVRVLQSLGLAAALEGVNEIEVGGRRIAGTGGGQIQDAVVVTGNILFDFDYDAMARAWKAPSEAFRRFAAEALRRSVTTLRRELPQVPSIEMVKRFLAGKYPETLGRPLVPASLTGTDEEAIARADVEMVGPASGVENAGQTARRLKIARGVFVREGEVSTPAGPVRLTLALRDGVIKDLALAGAPPSWVTLAEALKGVEAREADLLERLRSIGGGDGIGEASRAFVGAILAVKGEEASLEPSTV